MIEHLNFHLRDCSAATAKMVDLTGLETMHRDHLLVPPKSDLNSLKLNFVALAFHELEQEEQICYIFKSEIKGYPF